MHACRWPEKHYHLPADDVLVPGAHLLPLDPDVDDAPPLSAAGLEARLAELAERKAEAIARDDLELALRWKKEMATVRRRAQMQGPRL